MPWRARVIVRAWPSTVLRVIVGIWALAIAAVVLVPTLLDRATLGAAGRTSRSWPSRPIASRSSSESYAPAPGERIAAVTSSWGGPGTFPHRYTAGKRQLEAAFGVEVVEMPYTLADPAAVAADPAARADDLNRAFADPDIAGAVSTVAGDDSIRMLRHLEGVPVGGPGRERIAGRLSTAWPLRSPGKQA